ncbi:porin family protein [Hymenobacter nivis]|uniref:PorT family protein n=1 Tax=Hymenobacter nivis TaxID=1850093 RepID=A0A502GLX1_9BACT|nr:porin family protein [Hymenobacter nivis]TPG62290.1 PorT family protein [Hymenobacter nivis]
MKKLFLVLSALVASATAASAQVEIGVKVSPSVSYLRAESPSSTAFANESSKFSFAGALIVDYFFGENYAFGTGLALTGKGGTISYTERNPLSSSSIGTRVNQKIATQYIELPVTLKLFTNELAPATRLYFQLGGSLAAPIATRINNEKFYQDPYNNNNETKASEHVFVLDVNALLGAGVEYQLGHSTKLLAGLSYHRGLVNLDHYFEKTRGFSDVAIKNNVFALDLGMKF